MQDNLRVYFPNKKNFDQGKFSIKCNQIIAVRKYVNQNDSLEHDYQNSSNYMPAYEETQSSSSQMQNKRSYDTNLPLSPICDAFQDRNSFITQHYGQNLGHLIDWINSFNDPYCLLVNSIADLRDGIALCHLVGFLTCTPSDQEKIRQLVYYDLQNQGDQHLSEQNRENLILQNLDLALNILKNSQIPISNQMMSLNSQKLLADDEQMILFVQTLKQTQDLIGMKNDNLPFQGQQNLSSNQLSPITSHQNSRQQNYIVSGRSHPHGQNIFNSPMGTGSSNQVQKVNNQIDSSSFQTPNQNGPHVNFTYSRNQQNATIHEDSLNAGSQYRSNLGNIHPNQYSSTKSPVYSKAGVLGKENQVGISNRLNLNKDLQNAPSIKSKPENEGASAIMITPRNMPLQMRNRSSQNQTHLIQCPSYDQSNKPHFYEELEENSLEINNISPINYKNSITPINAKAFNSTEYQQQFDQDQQTQSQVLMKAGVPNQQQTQNAHLSINQSRQLQDENRDPNQNPQAFIQYQQEMQKEHSNLVNKDPYELQLEQEIKQIDQIQQSSNHQDLKFMNLQKDYSSNNKQFLSKDHEASNSSFRNNSNHNISSAAREKQKIKHLQSLNSDYDRVIRNSSQKLQSSSSKTVDSSVMQNLRVYNKNSATKAKLPLQLDQQTRQDQISLNTVSQLPEAIHSSRINESMNIPLQQNSTQRSKSGLKSEPEVVGPSDDDAEEIMNEMQTLNVLPESKDGSRQANNYKPTSLLLAETQIDAVDIKTQYKVIDWLIQDVKLLKQNEKLLVELPLYCKNGVFFCDLVNRLNGKHPIIKGIDRSPKNMTSIINNLNKIMEYFRQFPKFNARYLWAQRHIIDGNSDVIWGILDDIWFWHHKKTSPFDRSSQPSDQDFKISKSRSREDTRSANQRQIAQPNFPVILGGDALETQNTTFSLATQKSTLQAKPPLSIHNQSALIQTKKESNLQIQGDRQLIRDRSYGSLAKIYPKSTHHSSENAQKHIPNLKLAQQANVARQTVAPNLSSRNQVSVITQHGTMIDMPLLKIGAINSARNNSSSGYRTARNASRDQSQLMDPNQRVNGVNCVNVSQNDSFQGQKSAAKNSSMRRRRDVSNIHSPIARDQTGKFYYTSLPSDHKKDNFQVQNLLSLNANILHNYEHLVLSDDMISEVRQWLFNLGFQSYLSREFEHKDICGDPFSNGVLLAELFSYLERVTLFKIVQYPSTISECKENLSKILSVISQRRRDFPPRLLTEESMEKILKRDKQITYAILYYLKQFYPDALPMTNDFLLNNTNAAANCSQMSSSSNHGNAARMNLNLPYSQGEIKLLETSILNWLKSMGVLIKFRENYLDIFTLLELQKDFSNGSLISEIVQIMFNTKIIGIFKDPKTESTMLSNIRKSLEILRRQNKMSQKFTWAEREIFEGQMHVIIGLLEDLHRCFDGLPPRKRGENYFRDGPYVGETLYSVQPYLKHKLHQLSLGKNSNENSLGRDVNNLSKVDHCLSTINQTLNSYPISNVKIGSGLSNVSANGGISSGGYNLTHNQQMVATQSSVSQIQEVPSLLVHNQKANCGSYQSRFQIQNNLLAVNYFEQNATTLNEHKIQQQSSSSNRQGINTLSPVSYRSSSQEKKPNFGAFLNVKLNKESQDICKINNDSVNYNDMKQKSLSPPSLSKNKVRFDDGNYNPFQPTKLKATNLILDDEALDECERQTFQQLPEFKNKKDISNQRMKWGESGSVEKTSGIEGNRNRIGNHKINDLVLPQKTDLTSQYPVAPTRSPLNLRSQNHSIEFEGGSHIKRPSNISIEDYENEEHYQNRYAFTHQEKQKISKWLAGFQIHIPQSFYSDSKQIKEFRDGILLSQIVGKLENHNFENIQMQPKSSASCIQNIKKALQLLKKKNQVPLYLLYSEEEIHNGNNEIIFQLLKSLRQAYKGKVMFQKRK